MMNRRANFRNGFTMIEAMVSMFIVSVLMVATIRASGVAVKYTSQSSDHARAAALADALMNEICVLSYQDSISPVFGCESGESSTSKANYNDVDDFDGWTESPPQTRAGSIISELGNWSRTVSVTRVTTTTFSAPSAGESGAKRITVTIRRNNVVLATRVAIRTDAP